MEVLFPTFQLVLSIVPRDLLLECVEITTVFLVEVHVNFNR